MDALRWNLIETVGPASEPVTTAELKKHMRVDITEDDPYIDSIAKVVRLALERETRRAFINTTFAVSLPRFPAGDNPIRPPRSNLVSVSSIAYIDQDGTSQTWANTLYKVDTASEPGRIRPVFGEVYPDTREEDNAVTVTFVAGFGATAAAVPEDVKHMIKFWSAQLYENREPVVLGVGATTIPRTLKSLIRGIKVQDLEVGFARSAHHF